jgi:hypothetical protein
MKKKEKPKTKEQVAKEKAAENIVYKPKVEKR